MGHRLRGPGVLLGTTLGRRHIRYGLCHRSGPLLLGVAGLYRRLGARTAQVASRAVVLATGTNGAALKAGTQQGGLPAEAIRSVRSVHAALDELRDLAPGDVVLIKGATYSDSRASLSRSRDGRCAAISGTAMPT